jgi:hypothetical protein
MRSWRFELKDPEERCVYPEAGFCIYCGKDELSREHIFPAGLGGKRELPSASCTDCAKITGSMEQRLLRGAFWPVRVRLGIHSGRRAGERPNDFDVEFWKGEERQMLNLPVSKVPVYLMMPVLKPPAILTKQDWAKDGSFNQVTITSFDDGFILDSLNMAIADAGAEKIGLGAVVDTFLLMRLIAKVLHGYAHAELKGKFTPYLNDIILSPKHERSAYYVGGMDTDLTHPTRNRLGLGFHHTGNKTLIIGMLVLLNPHLLTSFIAVIGELPTGA